MCVRVCVYVCVRERESVCVCLCASVCVITYANLHNLYIMYNIYMLLYICVCKWFIIYTLAITNCVSKCSTRAHTNKKQYGNSSNILLCVCNRLLLFCYLYVYFECVSMCVRMCVL